MWWTRRRSMIQRTRELPPVLRSALTEKISALQAREFDLGLRIRAPFEEFLLDWRTRLERFFLTRFVVSLDPITKRQVWDPVLAMRAGLTLEVDEPMQRALLDLEEDLVAAEREVQRDAFLYGLLIGRWQMALGGIDLQAARWPGFLLPAIAGLGLISRTRAWGRVSRAKIKQVLTAAVLSRQTIMQTVAMVEAVLLTYAKRVTSLVQNEVYRAVMIGEQRAAHGYPVVGLWITKDDELVCKICEPLHLTYTSKIPVDDTHPDCRCSKILIARKFAPHQMTLTTFTDLYGTPT